MIFGFGKKSSLFEAKKKGVQDRQKEQQEQLEAHTDGVGKIMSKREMKRRAEAKNAVSVDEQKDNQAKGVSDSPEQVTEQMKERDLRNAADNLHQGLPTQVNEGKILSEHEMKKRAEAKTKERDLRNTADNLHQGLPTQAVAEEQVNVRKVKGERHVADDAHEDLAA